MPIAVSSEDARAGYRRGCAGLGREGGRGLTGGVRRSTQRRSNDKEQVSLKDNSLSKVNTPVRQLRKSCVV